MDQTRIRGQAQPMIDLAPFASSQINSKLDARHGGCGLGYDQIDAFNHSARGHMHESALRINCTRSAGNCYCKFHGNVVVESYLAASFGASLAHFECPMSEC